jgi:predicted anti-sigma-YlaC factor YlaD
MSMSCSFDRELIQKYADNSIDPLEFIFLREHMNYCGECRLELDLVMTLERELEKFFGEDINTEGLDNMIAKLVDDCIDEVERKHRLKYAVASGVRLGSRIMGYTTRFVGFLPGSRRMSKGAAMTASKTGGFLKGLVKKKVGRLHISFE